MLTDVNMKGELFDVCFNPFNVTLLKPIHVVEDYTAVKTHTKRVLVEIADSYSEPLYLTWSGGFDTAFLLLCFLELVKENVLPITTFSLKGAEFVYEGERVCKDWERGLDFLQKVVPKDLDISIEPCDLSVRHAFTTNAAKLVKEIRRPAIGCLIQEQWRRKQKGSSIIGICYPNRTDDTSSLIDCMTDQFWHYLENSSVIEVYSWDADIYSTFITPFYLDKPFVDFNKNWHYNSYLWRALNTKMPKFISFLLCFPILYELFPKIATAPSSLHPHFEKLAEELDYFYRDIKFSTHIKLPNNEIITSVDQIQKYFNV